MIYLLLFLASVVESSWASHPCNGSERNCSLPYNEVSFFTTHNSFNYSCRGSLKKTGPLHYLFPNQDLPIENQLEEGVRAFMIDLHSIKGESVFCHGGKACGLLGKEPVLANFTSLAKWMNDNPHEVITLILESYISSSDLKTLLVDSGLRPFLHCQSNDQPWPTLGEMVQAAPVVDFDLNQPCTKSGRLVILNDRVEEGDPDWNLDLFSKFAVETRFSYSSPSKLDCTLNRGVSSNSLFILNHFTTWISGKRMDAKKMNRYAFLKDRVDRCERETGRRINFVTVDFYRTGQVKRVVDQLNASRIDSE